MARNKRCDCPGSAGHCVWPLKELKQPGCTLALVKFAFLLDHYVAVLDVDDKTVTVGDPLTGKQTLTHAEFAQKWRRVGVVLKRKS